MAQSKKHEDIGYGSLQNLHGRCSGEDVWTNEERELWEPGYHPSDQRVRQKIEELDEQLANMRWIQPAERKTRFIETDSRLDLLLLGKPGVGKSATANTLVGREVFPTDPGMQRQSFTKQKKEKEIVHEGTTYCVIDSPSLSTSQNGYQTLKPIANPPLRQSRKQAGTVYLYVTSGVRFTQDIKDDITHNLIRHPDMLDRTIGVVSHGNEKFRQESVQSLLSKQNEDVSFLDPLNGFVKFRSIIGVHNYNDYTDTGPCPYVQRRQRETLLELSHGIAASATGSRSDKIMRIRYNSGHACLCFCPRSCECQCLWVSRGKCIWSGRTRRCIAYTVIICIIIIGLVLGVVLWKV